MNDISLTQPPSHQAVRIMLHRLSAICDNPNGLPMATLVATALSEATRHACIADARSRVLLTDSHGPIPEDERREHIVISLADGREYCWDIGPTDFIHL